MRTCSQRTTLLVKIHLYCYAGVIAYCNVWGIRGIKQKEFKKQLNNLADYIGSKKTKQ